MEPAFYDENDTESWLQIVGVPGHYHFGNGPDIIRYLYKYIPDGARVIDCGCGWGGPAALLASEKGCTVTGVTISENQFAFIRDRVPGVRVIHADMATFQATENFDVALFVQSFTHMTNPVQVLRNTRARAVVIQDFLGLKGYYYDHGWRMNFYGMRDYHSLFAAAGYTVRACEVMDDEESLGVVRRDAESWIASIDRLPPDRVRGQIRLLRDYSVGWAAMQAYDVWCQVIFHLEKTSPEEA